MTCATHSILDSLSLQAGDSAAMRAVQFYRSAPLRELVRAGCDLNLQNQVRHTVTVDTAPHVVLIRRASQL